MNHADPRRRKPIRDKVPLDEITDNVKNDAVLTRSRSKTKYNLPNSEDEEFVDFHSSNELHQTFVISSSSQNFVRRNRQKGRNQSPGVNNREPYNLSRSDISDDDEDSDELTKQSLNHSDLESHVKNIRFKQPHIYRPESCRYGGTVSPRSKSSKNTLNSTNGIYFLLFLFISGFLLYCFIFRTKSVEIGTQTEASDVDSKSQVLNDVLNTLQNMKSKYKNQNRDLWLDAYSSIATLINQKTKKPSIIVLLGNKSNPLECLARLLGNVSSKALKSDRLVLTPKEFKADMGSVIQTMRLHLKDNKAIIVSDLLNINVEALKAFHNLCDRINPLVEEAIYIITVIADDYDDSSNPLEYIETKLHKKLSGKMKEDAIQPLITRLTDGPILTVKPEPTVTDCSL